MNFYRGVVENNKDPLNIGRVQVRVFAKHTPIKDGDFYSVPTESLPWAEVIGGTDFGLISGVGVSSILKQGTWVWVFYDNDNPNNPIVVGTIKGIVSGDHIKTADNVGFCDPAGVYPIAGKLGKSDLHENVVIKGDKTTVISTFCGHTIELDDDVQEITITHPSKTYIKIDKDGNISFNSVKNIFLTAAENIDMKAKIIKQNA